MPAFLSYLNCVTNPSLKNLLNLFRRLSSRSPPPDFPTVPTSRSLFLFFRRAARPFSFSTSPAVLLHHHRVPVGRVRLPGRDRRRHAHVLSFLFSYFVQIHFISLLKLFSQTLFFCAGFLFLFLPCAACCLLKL
jgi:hypothetical protein